MVSGTSVFPSAHWEEPFFFKASFKAIAGVLGMACAPHLHLQSFITLKNPENLIFKENFSSLGRISDYVVKLKPLD
jgi:hypothetical protein